MRPPFRRKSASRNLKRTTSHCTTPCGNHARPTSAAPPAASKIIAQDNEISRLETLYRAARERLATLESGVAVGQFNHRLRTLSAANEQLANATRTIEMLDDSLRAARGDWARLARERELAIMDLASDARHLLHCHANPSLPANRLSGQPATVRRGVHRMSDHPFHVAGGSFPAPPRPLETFDSRLQRPPTEAATPVRGSRRRKLWEIAHKFHCPVIGVCFDVDELRGLMTKVMHFPRDTSDFVLHTTAVGAAKTAAGWPSCCTRRWKIGYARIIRRFAASKTADGVRQLWREATASGVELPGALWAAWTHPSATACSNTKSTATST